MDEQTDEVIDRGWERRANGPKSGIHLGPCTPLVLKGSRPPQHDGERRAPCSVLPWALALRAALTPFLTLLPPLASSRSSRKPSGRWPSCQTGTHCHKLQTSARPGESSRQSTPVLRSAVLCAWHTTLSVHGAAETRRGMKSLCLCRRSFVRTRAF